MFKKRKDISIIVKMAASDIFGGDPDSKTRKRECVDARIAITAYILNKQKRKEEPKKYNLTELGEAFAAKIHHATIIHYYKLHNSLIQSNRDYRLKYLQFVSILKSIDKKNEEEMPKTICNTTTFAISKVNI